MNAPRTALARLDDEDVRAAPRARVRRPGGGGGFGSLTPERARILLIVAARASSVTLLLILALVFTTLFAAGSGMTGAPGGVAASWLAVHQVPLTIGKADIGLWPLLPTAFLLWLVAKDCARATEPDSTPADLGWIAGAAVGGPLLVTAVCLAVADDASAVVALRAPNTSLAFAWVIGLHLLAAAAGVGSRRWRDLLDLLPIPLPDWVIPGVRAGALALARLLAVAAALTVVSFLAHWSRIGDTYATAGNFVGVLGLTLLSLAFLPNVTVDAASVLLGGQVHIGPGSLGLFGIEGAPVPAVPIMAAVPSGPAAAWWAALLIVPAAVGVLSGLDCGSNAGDHARAPWAMLTAAGVATVLLAALGLLAGGELGSFGWIGPNVPLALALAFVWLALPGYVGVLAARFFAPTVAGTAAADEDYEYDDYDDDYADDDYDEYENGEYEDDEYEPDYDNEYYIDPDGDPDREDALDGELVDEQPALAAEPHDDSAADPDIVDAEVVEGPRSTTQGDD
ncbi:cell division protein PerM [Nocardia sp. IFM 10818]